jgi:XTP/dITP diphosphohydrolase
MKLVIASNNKGKLREIREIMAGSGIEVLSQREAGCDFEAEETGTTFTANARIKALAAMRATGLPAAADDSGLEVNAMDGGPGVYSSRFCGERSYAEACKEIISIVDGKPDRGARYCCAVVCCFPDGREITCFATTEGEIAHDLRGSGGFGYDPMFLLPDGRTMAELAPEEKNAISHRGRAFRELLRKLKDGEYDADQ